jgi:hypothetical protein
VRAALGAGAIALLLGCYRYEPATLAIVPSGSAVRATLSSEAQLALRDSLGLRRQTVQGTLVERAADRWLLAVRTDAADWRPGAPPLYQRIAVASRDVLAVEVRRLRRGRTAGLLAAVAAAVTIGVVEVIRRGNPGTPQTGGGGPPE